MFVVRFSVLWHFRNLSNSILRRRLFQASGARLVHICWDSELGSSVNERLAQFPMRAPEQAIKRPLRLTSFALGLLLAVRSAPHPNDLSDAGTDPIPRALPKASRSNGLHCAGPSLRTSFHRLGTRRQIPRLGAVLNGPTFLTLAALRKGEEHVGQRIQGLSSLSLGDSLACASPQGARFSCGRGGRAKHHGHAAGQHRAHLGSEG